MSCDLHFKDKLAELRILDKDMDGVIHIHSMVILGICLYVGTVTGLNIANYTTNQNLAETQASQRIGLPTKAIMSCLTHTVCAYLPL